MGPVLLCARLGGMAVSAHRTQTRSVSAYRRPECLLKSRMCERHLSGSERAWAATFGEHPVYSTCAFFCGSLLPHGVWTFCKHIRWRAVHRAEVPAENSPAREGGGLQDPGPSA